MKFIDFKTPSWTKINVVIIDYIISNKPNFFEKCKFNALNFKFLGQGT
jgi:hypothetical protein